MSTAVWKDDRLDREIISSGTVAQQELPTVVTILGGEQDCWGLLGYFHRYSKNEGLAKLTSSRASGGPSPKIFAVSPVVSLLDTLSVFRGGGECVWDVWLEDKFRLAWPSPRCLLSSWTRPNQWGMQGIADSKPHWVDGVKQSHKKGRDVNVDENFHWKEAKRTQKGMRGE